MKWLLSGGVGVLSALRDAFAQGGGLFGEVLGEFGVMVQVQGGGQGAQGFFDGFREGAEGDADGWDGLDGAFVRIEVKGYLVVPLLSVDPERAVLEKQLELHVPRVSRAGHGVAPP